MALSLLNESKAQSWLCDRGTAGPAERLFEKEIRHVVHDSNDLAGALVAGIYWSCRR